MSYRTCAGIGSGIRLGLGIVLGMTALFAPVHLRAQDDDGAAPKHGRKYKAPPETAHIEVTVIKGFNKKPIMNAAVVFHPVKDGRDDGTLEMKTDPDGKATIDVIPMGSQVRVQVIANGFATYAQDFDIKEANRRILVTMVRPQAQISAYTDNEGKAAQLTPGVQEPVRPKKAVPPAGPTSGGATPMPASGVAPATMPASSTPPQP